MSKKFEELFLEKLDELERRARAAGANWTRVCVAAGAGRATPDRWRRQIPKTVRLVTEMERAVEAFEKIAVRGSPLG